MNPLRTVVYIDGFNLYYGLVKNSPFKWLDLAAMCSLYLNTARNPVHRIKYFTARVIPRPKDPTQNVRQETYLRALRTFPEIEIIFGHFLSHKVTLPLANGTGYATVIKTEEKKSDVNIAVHMLHDAYRDEYDLAVLVSNDSDLSEALRIISQELGKKIAILNPHKRPTAELKKYALFYKQIRPGALANCQLPLTLQDTHGLIQKPSVW